MRSGVALIELVVVVTVAGIIAAIALPRIVVISDSAAVRDETLRAVTALDAARGAAGRLNGVATLTLSPGSYRATVIVGPDTVVAWAQGGNAPSGVALSGAGTPLLFGPAGLAMGVSNRTIVLTKGSALRRVVVSKLGRITY